jgi:hypothetical protein
LVIVEGKISISEILKKRKGSLPENFTIISCGGGYKDNWIRESVLKPAFNKEDLFAS